MPWIFHQKGDMKKQIKFLLYPEKSVYLFGHDLTIIVKYIVHILKLISTKRGMGRDKDYDLFP